VPWVFARDDFRPAPWLRNRHLQTVAPVVWPAGREEPLVEERVVAVSGASAVAVRIEATPRSPRGTLLLIHGVGGSAESGYMLRTSRLARERGFAAARMNCRNAGGTEHLSRTLFNAGQSDDVGRVLAALEDWGLPRPYCLVGFSLGGNLALRYAGLAGRDSLADAVAALNPPIDLEACSRALLTPRNRPYGLFFTYELCTQLRRIRRNRPVPGPAAAWWKVRTVWNFDERFVAPDAGYASAVAYYEAASSRPCLGGLRIPALVLSAADDPFVPVEIFRSIPDLVPGRLVLAHPRRGGHLGYWQRGRPRFWAAPAVLEFFEAMLPAGRD
jgi:predicted alpha/beta-fold hydrolase